MYQKPRHFRSFRNSPLNRGGFKGSPGRPNRPKSKLAGKDINIFIKKAQPSLETQDYTPTHTFDSFPVAPALKQNIAIHGYTIPTPIQDQAIEPILQGRDLIGLANTGTGKTAAFLIPVINKIYQDRAQGALIVVPTRELAQQILDELRALSENMKISSTIVIGGANINRQMNDLRRNPHVVIATPGRLRDLIERRAIFLEDYSTFILDEVDLMVDIGFINDIRYFISLLPKIRQSLFFSATIPVSIHQLLQSFVANPVTISVKVQDTSSNVDQDVVVVRDQTKKVDLLHDLLIKDGFEKVLIFGRTKHSIDKLHRELGFRGFKVEAIHGNKSQGQRQRALDSFKQSQVQVLLATDVASRGLDIPNVSHVINYDLPETYEDYIHRIGRTGRAGKTGQALTFVEQHY